MSGFANTARQAMALLALLFAMLAGPAAASADAGSSHAAAMLAAEQVETSVERQFEGPGEPASIGGDGDAIATAALAFAPGARSETTSAVPLAAPSRRDLATQGYRARAPPRR